MYKPSLSLQSRSQLPKNNRRAHSAAERKDGPLEPEIAHCGYGVEQRGQLAITAAREKPRSRALLAGMLALDEMDPRRMAFLEASAKNGGAPIRAVMSSWPTKQRHITPDQFHTGACTYMHGPPDPCAGAVRRQPDRLIRPPARPARAPARLRHPRRCRLACPPRLGAGCSGHGPQGLPRRR